ncbi:MAG: CatA-like O-acetyltransferase [Clostridia bacterium]|nr:CatA-like O-acetyltransferase [Clostridia bacterium]
MRTVPIEKWERREEYEHFIAFPNPFFDVTVRLNVTNLLRRTKAKEIPFYGALIYATMKTVNSMDEFLCRVHGGDIVYYDEARPFFVDMDKETHKIKFVTYPMCDDMAEFAKGASAAGKASHGLYGSTGDSCCECKVFISCSPQIAFTAFTAACHGNAEDFTPNITWGKYYEADDGEMLIPCAAKLNHCAQDAHHASMFFTLLQKIIDEAN